MDLEAARGSFAEHVGHATTTTNFSAMVDAKVPTISGLSVKGINLLNARDDRDDRACIHNTPKFRFVLMDNWRHHVRLQRGSVQATRNGGNRRSFTRT